MPEVLSNDLVEDLIDENKRLLKELLFADKCLKIMTEFKTFIDFISIQFINQLESEVWKKYEELSERVDLICGHKKINVNNGVISNECQPQEKIVIPKKFRDNGVLTNCDPEEAKSTLKTGHKSNASKKGSINCGPYKCGHNGCGKRFLVQRYLRRHEKRHKENEMTSHNKTSFKHNLQKHQSSHSNQRIQCRFCDRSYKQSEQLVKHEKTVHQSGVKNKINKSVVSVKTGPKRLVCPTLGCHYSTVHHSGMSAHKTSHSDDRPFSCFQCGNRFKQRKHLIRHLKIHENTYNKEYVDINQEYVCQWVGCQYRSTTSDNLKQHIILKHYKK